MKIKVCGPGCANCRQAEEGSRAALAEAGRQATAVKVTDFAELAALGGSTPAMVIDGLIKGLGKGPSPKEILAWIK